MQHRSELFNNVDLFLHHKQLTSVEIGNKVICTCAGFSFGLICGKIQFMFFIHIVVVVKVPMSPMVNQFF